MIEEVEATNFMSYDSFSIKLEEGMNLLVGEKGSGKTSVLEAIRLAFGGLGRERQDVLADFIKKGANNCKITVKLSNSSQTFPKRKLMPSLPKKESIIIERELYRNKSSVYKLNGSRTRKYHLLDILSRIGVTPKNKLFFLPQEKVNQWVNIGREKRLEMYLRALGLLELKRKIDNLRGEIREKREERKEYLRVLNKWEKRAEEKKEKILEPGVAKETLERYYTFKLAKLIHEKQKVEIRLKRKEKDEKEMQKEVEQLEEAVKTLKKRIENTKKEREETSKKWQKLMMEKKPEFSDSKNRLERKIKRKQAQLEKLSSKYKERFSKIREIKEKWHIEKTEEIQDLIEDRKKEIEEAEERLLENSKYKKIQQLEKELNELQQKKNTLKSQSQQHKRKLNKLLKKTDPPALHKIYSKLLQKELIQKENKHEGRIFGPLGLEIEFKTPIDEAKEYSFAIENGLGDLMFSFLILDERYYEQIREICRRIKDGHRNQILLMHSNSSKTLQNVVTTAKNHREELKKAGKEKLGKYKGSIVAWLPEIIDAPLPVKALIENLNWNVPIVTEISIAKEIAKRLSLEKVVTLKGEVIKRIHEGEEITISVLRPPSLRSKKDSLIEDSLGFTIGKFLKQKNTIKKEIDKLKTRIDEKQQVIERSRQKLPLEVKRLFEKQSKLEKEITELKQDENSLERLKKQREKEIKKRERIKDEIEKIKDRIDGLADKLTEVDEKIDALREKEGQLVNKKEELKENRESKFRKMERLKSKIEDLPLLLNALEKEKQSKEEEIAQTKKETRGFIKMLRDFGIYPKKELDTLLQEHILKNMRKIQEMDIGTIKEGLRRLEEYSKDYRQAIKETEEKMKEVKRMKKKAETYREKIRKVEQEKKEIERLCKKESKELLSIIKEKTEAIDRNYQRILSYLGANGGIKVKGDRVENLSLKTTIDLHRENPLDVSKAGFSSGEKTIAIMAMIMAILLTSPAPVYIWDEFEVFLDNRSLRSVITLIKHALDDHQGVLTTTHREELIKAADQVFFTQYNKEKRKSQIIPIVNPQAKQIQNSKEFGKKWSGSISS